MGIELREYQKRNAEEGARLLRERGLVYYAMECRTGKTLTALECARLAGARSVLFLTKKKAIPSVMADWEMLSPGYAIDVLNYESAHKAMIKPDIVILDEAHTLGTYPRPSLRAKTARELCKGKPVIYLSGTPSPESFSQLYHQFWCSDRSPFKEWKTFYKWAKDFVAVEQRMRNGVLINDYSDADKAKIDAATEGLFIDFTQSEAGFTAEVEEEVAEVAMTAWTRGAMEILQRRKVLMWPGSTVMADTPVKMMGKMHQLSSGTCIDEDGKGVVCDTRKAEYIRDNFKGRKVAVFYVYQTELEMLRMVFPRITSSPEEFQASGGGVLFAAQIRSAREGVRLDTADVLVFLNVEYSYLSYEQGRNRLVSKERKGPARVCFLVSDCGVERHILDAVRSKRDFTSAWFKRYFRN